MKTVGFFTENDQIAMESGYNFFPENHFKKKLSMGCVFNCIFFLYLSSVFTGSCGTCISQSK